MGMADNRGQGMEKPGNQKIGATCSEIRQNYLPVQDRRLSIWKHMAGFTTEEGLDNYDYIQGSVVDLEQEV